MFKPQNKKYLNWSIFGLLVGLFILPPSSVLAARIYFSPSSFEIYQDDVFIVETRISSPEELINAAEVNIEFNNKKLEVKELSAGNSVFVLWPKMPSFSNQDGKISFIGGTPDGFQGEEARVLKIIFLAKDTGEAKLDFQDNTLFFLHDGKGAPINPWLRSLSLNILERPAEIVPRDEWQLTLEKDQTPPEPFEITPGKGPSIFDNQYFIGFFTTDAESGIDYYEVQEGDRDFIRAESPYLLEDQSLQSLIKVKAVDKAGNERIEELMPSAPVVPFYKNILFWIVVFIIIVIFYILWRYFKRRTKI